MSVTKIIENSKFHATITSQQARLIKLLFTAFHSRVTFKLSHCNMFCHCRFHQSTTINSFSQEKRPLLGSMRSQLVLLHVRTPQQITLSVLNTHTYTHPHTHMQTHTQNPVTFSLSLVKIPIFSLVAGAVLPEWRQSYNQESARGKLLNPTRRGWRHPEWAESQVSGAQLGQAIHCSPGSWEGQIWEEAGKEIEGGQLLGILAAFK